MSEELKSCPFCGSAPELLDGGSVTAIRCSSDQCISRPEPFNDWGHKESAIAAWNRRTQPEPAHTGDDMLKLSHLDRALKHEEMLDRSRDRAKYPQPEPAAPAEQDWSEPELWAEIYRLRAAVKGPDGFDSWQDAATDERIRRVRAERALAAPSVAPEPLHVDETKRYRVVQKGYWWRVQIGDGQQTVGRCCSQTGAQHLAHALVVAYRDGFFVASQAAHPPRAPLTDAEIVSIMESCLNDWDWKEFARAVESAVRQEQPHG